MPPVGFFKPVKASPVPKGAKRQSPQAPALVSPGDLRIITDTIQVLSPVNDININKSDGLHSISRRTLRVLISKRELRHRGHVHQDSAAPRGQGVRGCADIQSKGLGSRDETLLQSIF